MGRGKQKTLGDIEESTGNTQVQDFRSLANQRRLVIVALLAAFLPFIITRSYIYYANSDASTEALNFFQRRPFASLTPFKQHEISLDPDATHGQEELKPGETEKTTSNLDASATEDGTHNDTNGKQAKTDNLSETNRFVNESTSTLVITGKGQANTERGDLQKSTSPSLNVTTINNEVLKQNSDESPDGHQSGPGSKNTTNTGTKGTCDLVKGKWVPDSSPLQYTNSTCNYIQGHQNCIRNGRPDMGFLYWKWQPDQCDLPRIDPRAFLIAMRNRSMIFVGDSIARNQFQSLLCLLSQVATPNHTYSAPDDRDNVYVFPTHNFTLTVYWSPYLVHMEEKDLTWPDNRTQTVAHIHLDKLDKAWVERISGADFVQLSTGQWWFKRGLFLHHGQPIGGHICDGWAPCEEIGFEHPYRTSIHNVLKGSLSIPGYTGTTIFRTFSPDHFEGGPWDKGGHCNRTAPGGMEISWLASTMYDVQVEEFRNVTGDPSLKASQKLMLLDVTNIAQIRADGHPNSYREFQPFSKENSNKPIQNDCLHWCLPGPIDTWNDLLLESLRDVIYH